MVCDGVCVLICMWLQGQTRERLPSSSSVVSRACFRTADFRAPRSATILAARRSFRIPLPALLRVCDGEHLMRGARDVWRLAVPGVGDTARSRLQRYGVNSSRDLLRFFAVCRAPVECSPRAHAHLGVRSAIAGPILAVCMISCRSISPLITTPGSSLPASCTTCSDRILIWGCETAASYSCDAASWASSSAS
jgi:hypothetical protein